MRYFLFLILLILPGCHSTSTDIGAVRTETAFINNTNLFVDGCEPFINLDTGSSSVLGTQYKPSPTTLPAVQKLIAVFPDSTRIPVNVQFVETGSQVKIQCGWSSPTVSEIKVLAITKR